VSTDLAVTCISDKWHLISVHSPIPHEEFLIAIRFVLNSTIFTFNRKYYKQIFITPMGSPLSPIVADLVLQHLETRAINMLPTRLPFYYRYVDDIFLACPYDLVNNV